MTYKIRINCTNKRELCFNGTKINKELYYDIHNKLLPMYIDYIDKIMILSKTTNSFTTAKSFTTKSLEFICNREIDEMEFNEFIVKIMNSRTIITQIKNTNNPVVKYNLLHQSTRRTPFFITILLHSGRFDKIREKGNNTDYIQINQNILHNYYIQRLL